LNNAKTVIRLVKKHFLRLIPLLALFLIGYHYVSQWRALLVIKNTNSPPDKFFAAINHVGRQVEPSTFWLKIATDKRYASDDRRRCVKYFFDNYVHSGMRLGELVETIGIWTNWISFDHITLDSRDTTGPIPGVMLTNQCSFTIPILLESSGSHHLVIFIGFKENMQREDFIQTLRGSVNVGTASNVIIGGSQTWDDEDEWEACPISKSYPWPWLSELHDSNNTPVWITLRFHQAGTVK
jgi:hypothetical protein